MTDFVCGRPPGYPEAAPPTAGTEPDVCDVFAPAIADWEWAAYVHALQVRAARLLLPRIVLARGSPSLLRSEIASDRWFLPSLVLEDPEVELALAGTPAGT